MAADGRFRKKAAASRERVGDLKGPPRRIAIVAFARKLLVALWRFRSRPGAGRRRLQDALIDPQRRHRVNSQEDDNQQPGGLANSKVDADR
jgi:hypothetical protein